MRALLYLAAFVLALWVAGVAIRALTSATTSVWKSMTISTASWSPYLGWLLVVLTALVVVLPVWVRLRKVIRGAS